jgi:EpsI family protein
LIKLDLEGRQKVELIHGQIKMKFKIASNGFGSSRPNRDHVMKIHLRALVAGAVILLAAGLAHVMTPTELMARSSDTFDLQSMIPRQFGEWTQVPGILLVEPTEPDALERQLYAQEIGRGYADRDGHIVMLVVAYGPSQSNRLQLHRPEVCYVAEGFRVFPPFETELSYRDGAPPLKLKRLIAQRPLRFEPISYWMRVGDRTATGVFDRQLIKLMYGLRGIIPDGMLVRVSTVGLTETAAYAVQDRFIRDLLAALGPENLKYFVGARPSPLDRS